MRRHLPALILLAGFAGCGGGEPSQSVTVGDTLVGESVADAQRGPLVMAAPGGGRRLADVAAAWQSA